MNALALPAAAAPRLTWVALGRRLVEPDEESQHQEVILPKPGHIYASAVACWIAFKLAVPHAWRGSAISLEDQKDPVLVRAILDQARQKRGEFDTAMGDLVQAVRAGSLTAHGQAEDGYSLHDKRHPPIPKDVFADPFVTITDLDRVQRSDELPSPSSGQYRNVCFEAADILRLWPEPSRKIESALEWLLKEAKAEQSVGRLIKLADAVKRLPKNAGFSVREVKAAFSKLPDDLRRRVGIRDR